LSTERAATVLALACTAVLAACRQDMHNQPKALPLRPSTLFADGRSARPLVEGTVARGHLETTGPYHTGRTAAGPVREIPVPVTADLLARGRERYDIYCSVCHDRVGRGEGMIVERGFRRPRSFHDELFRTAPAGTFFEAITKGFGVMPSYARVVPVADRWAIVAYIRALQLSQHATLDDVPAAERGQLEGEGPPP